MSWISKAENLLNKIDASAANVLQQQNKDETQILIPNQTKSKGIMSLKTTPSRLNKNDIDDKFDSRSETTSRRSSISSKHDTVIDKSDDHKSSHSYGMVESSSNASLNISFSVEKELAATKILVSELRSENHELKGELESLMEQIKVNGNAIKIQELEDLCSTLMEEKKSLIEITQSLENSNTSYVKTISELETTAMKLQQSENDLKQKLEYSKNESKDAFNELQQYRLRAQNQLQLKEKIIEKLQNGNVNDENSQNDPSNVQIELDQLRDQREHLQSELKLLNQRLDESKSFIEKMEHKHRMWQSESEDKISSLDSIINQLNLKCAQLEDETKLSKQELVQVRNEMLKQKTQMTTKLHEKENELRRMKNSFRETNSNQEIENRLHSLTQSLLSKQNNLEVITAERNALKLQFEKISNQHEELIIQLRHQRPQIININETDDAKSQIPQFLMLNPFDSRMSRRVKRAYSNLDQLGIQMGIFLRRYPLARIFSVFYVTLLHFFVVFVLLSSSPS